MTYFTRKFQKLSIRSRILLIFTSIVFLISIFLSTFSYFTVRKIYLNQLEEQVNLLTRNLISNINIKFLDLIQPTEDKALAREYYRKELSEKVRRMGFEDAIIFNQNFRILVQSEDDVEENNFLPALLLNKMEINTLQTDESITSEPFRGKDEQWYLWGFYRINHKYYIGVREDAGRLGQVDRLVLFFFFISIGSLFLTLLMGWLLAAMISKPIENLVHFSKELGKGNFEATIPKNIHGELEILSKSLDKMRLNLNRHHQEKEEMLAQIAHELRNPLGGIELLAGLVKEDLQKAGKNMVYIEKITSEIHTLKTLINDYLNFSRPVQVQSEKINLSAILDQVKEILLDQFHKKKLEILYRFEEPCIHFDPGHLRHILTNLIANSIEASPPASYIEVIQQKENNQFLLLIKDQGSGIHAENIDKIFDPFFSTKENGTGLGLAICKKLCHENRAEIWAENNSKNGCTIFIRGKPQVKDHTIRKVENL